MTCSPAASSACSSRRETCRQSSIAQTRSPWPPRSRAQRSAARCPGSSALIVRSPAIAPVWPSTAASEWERLWVSAPMMTMLVPSLPVGLCWKRTPADRPQFGAVPRSYQVTPVILGRRRATQPTQVSPTGRQRADEPARHQPEPGRQRAHGSARHRSENQPDRSDVTARQHGQ